MQLMENAGEIPLFIRRLLPNATERELESAAHTFRDYVAFVLRIHDRLHAEFTLQDSPNSADRDRFKNIARN